MIIAETARKLYRSYNARILVVFISAMVGFGVGIDSAFVNIQRDSYTEHMKHNGFALAGLLAQSLQVGVFSEDQSVIAEAVGFLPRQEEILQLLVVNLDGKVLLSNKGRHFNEKDEIRIKQPQPGRFGKVLFLDEETSFVFWQPVVRSTSFAVNYANDDDELSRKVKEYEDEGLIIGWVGIALSKSEFEQNVFRLRFKTGLTVAALLITAILCSMMLIRRMMIPLRQLVKRVDVPNRSSGNADDITVLNSTYVNLVSQLDNAFDTINDLRQGLEEKVEQRTKDLADANEKLEARQKVLEKSNLNLETALTNLKETQVRLVQSEKMAALGQLVAGVAHEINNNINFITTALPAMEMSLGEIKIFADQYRNISSKQDIEVILQALSKAEKKNEGVELDPIYRRIDQLMNSIREGTKRTIKIVGDLQVFSRRGMDALTLFNVNEALESTFNFVDYRYKHDVNLIKNFGKLPPVYCIGDRINQVFLNIMNNAVQAIGHEGGTLTISTYSKDEEVFIEFTDTGHGIAPEDLNKIYDPFFTRKVVGEGTGLGLGICYQIIAEHKGEITVESTVGEQTTFTVCLPLGRERRQELPDLPA